MVFFSRPGLLQVMTSQLVSDRHRVSDALARVNVTQLAAVVPTHSHYDHALDSALVADLTGATLMGSESTAQIGRGYGLSEKKIKVLKFGQLIQLGKFRIKILESAHSPSPYFVGDISHPVKTPAYAKDFKMGDCFSLIVEHENQKILVHGSGGYLPGSLNNQFVDVVYLGVGLLGKQSSDFRRNYWNEVVLATKAKRVFVIHWDDFFSPLNSSLVPLPFIIDNLM